MTPKDILAEQHGIYVTIDEGKQRTVHNRCAGWKGVKQREKTLTVRVEAWDARWVCFRCGERGSLSGGVENRWSGFKEAAE